MQITGPADTAFTVKGYSNGASGRFVEWRLNGGTSQNIEEGTNDSVVEFTGTTDANGEALLEYREGAGSSSTGYANAIMITPGAATPTPALSITGDLTAGSAFTINYSNFTGVPVSPATFTDSAGNSITVAVTISDNGDGTGTASGTMPALPSSGSVSGLKFGTITASLSTA